jgi:DNA-binding transcriptional MerR regulator
MVANKSKSAFRTIAEVAEELGVATHVLRFWETKFSQISPMKADGGRRYYRPDDVEIIRLIKDFLYNKRYTIEGVQKLLKDKDVKALIGGEIQKDFFESEEPLNHNEQSVVEKTVEVFKLTDSQRRLLGEIKADLQETADQLRKLVP